MNLLFDLDGTLTDPVEGIGRCLQHALQQLGHPPAQGSLAAFVGPPLRQTFAELLATRDPVLIERAVAHYRERFVEVGMFENAVYPGVLEALAALRRAGHRLMVVTSKPHVYARRIVGHFGLADLFTAVHGAELDGRNNDKVDLIRVVLATEGLDPEQTWMIGDRSFDVVGGQANGTRTAGVLWGYGSEAELRAARPDLLLATISELAAADWSRW